MVLTQKEKKILKNRLRIDYRSPAFCSEAGKA